MQRKKEGGGRGVAAPVSSGTADTLCIHLYRVFRNSKWTFRLSQYSLGEKQVTLVTNSFFLKQNILDTHTHTIN